MMLAQLHDTLQDAMGWTNSHLHCFEVAGRRIGMVGVEEDSPELEDERRVRITSVLPRKGARLVYRYDYGDDWEHVVEVEDVAAPDRRLAYPPPGRVRHRAPVAPAPDPSDASDRSALHRSAGVPSRRATSWSSDAAPAPSSTW